MELWMDLLFGNWIGLLSMFTIGFASVIVVFLWIWFIRKSSQTAK